MLNPLYLSLLSQKFGKDVVHILDCPESNIPMLSKTRATYFTNRIKMVCPLLFPTSNVGKTSSITEEMAHLLEKSTAKFEETQKAVGDKIDLQRSFHGL